ncbi:glutamate decarboxylase [Candidatus Methylacidiphilum fumarolicum]|uniref:Glutamate decarboxylase n=2 Tax=Candidatus Methylacidiphilum fumarolicum TaxID=591154 RepID=I0JVG0_METFB|nr:glutamate decarboxylase [Candidatus Methylacidiphilum fumarolicum]MBW6414867.1 glutamate decarboxylase [Candidatus Methylacidiphilum fumarolicum]TFE68307.1 glutamate decarboxylase [Candidatus Methylacidiphilum fumarolicum]TFE73533.1 glutamate decarboxylase [Candidatus Methylacidiphilum fumarolicum]TFE75006.1 glutamate decarboxylase [Candidatus Methylacidiphilum fumarolicum]TFE76550.1 glutamate decarboxylase [Candidatus Methylacidiphilum fumarolicum]
MHTLFDNHNHDNLEEIIYPAYARRDMVEPVPKYQLPTKGMPPEVAAQIIRDELMLEGNPRLNLATFVTTWMEKEAKELIAETLDKNLIDKDEYPTTAEIEKRCVRMIAKLFHGAAHEKPIGTSTIGSSEAIMLAGLAMKWNWKKRQKKTGNSSTVPNLVMGTNVQVVWEKFCRYFEVEPRMIPVVPGSYSTNPENVASYLDENTIGVVAILGTTYTGEFEPIEQIHEVIKDFSITNGVKIPLHIDAASGGFVAPFIHPELQWDFRLPLVESINVSGHKYGLVYPGIGWVIWRSEASLPEELIFKVNYLGGELPTFTLNFSRSGSQVIAQYYNFLRLGKEGYTNIFKAMQAISLHLADQIDSLGIFHMISRGKDIPVICFEIKTEEPFTVFDLSYRLREKGWQIPAYFMPPNAQNIAVMRIVIREGFSRDMADMLFKDIKTSVDELRSRTHRHPPKKSLRFIH